MYAFPVLFCFLLKRNEKDDFYLSTAKTQISEEGWHISPA